MAYLIPDNLRSRQDVAPVLRRVATALRLGLDDDAIAWFEPQWDPSGVKPHFVIFLPENGIAVAEVFDVRASKLLGALRGRIRIERDGKEIDVEQPLARAEVHAKELRQRIASESRLVGRELNVRAIALFPSLERDAAIERGLGDMPALNIAQCLFREEIEAAVAGEEAGMHRWFARTLGAATRTNDDLVDLVRSLVQPDLVIPGPGEGGQLSIFRAPEGQEIIRVMDKEQEALAKSMGDGHRVVRGVAGSGKTLILVYRARLLADMLPQHTFLFVCFNRSLASELRSLLSDVENVLVEPVHVLIGRAIRDAGLDDPGFADSTGETRAAVGLQALERGALSRYRGVFLDEAQDLGPNALRFVVGLADERFNDVLIAADAAQNIYRREFSWKDAGVQAQGRTKILRRNYRNTREVLELAYAFLVGAEVDESSLDLEDESVIIPPETALRTGVPVTLEICAGNELVARALAVIGTTLSKRTAPKSLGVLTMSNHQGIEIERLLRSSGIEHYFVTDPQKTQKRDEVADATAPLILATVYGAKGMEFPTVVLCCTPRNGQDLEELRRLMYVGMTRASERLIVLAASDHPLAGDLEAAANNE